MFIALLAVLVGLFTRVEGYLSSRLKGNVFMVQSFKMSDKKRTSSDNNRKTFNAPVNAYRNNIKTKEVTGVTVSPKAAPVDPKVQRLHLTSDRKELTSFAIGQKMKGYLHVIILIQFKFLTLLRLLIGRIISIKPFGFFVDIGAVKDGLVHVRDISKDYFIQNHQAKFTPGQDIDVWIKFIEGEKLGLQCFPVTPRLGEKNPALAVDINDVNEGDMVTGVVVRVSNYGVYVDIGCEVDAFLAARS